MNKITPCLWLDGHLDEAVRFYTAVFPGSKVGRGSSYGESGPLPKGTPMVAYIELLGQEFMLLNGGPMFKFNEAVSFVVDCKDQAEVDYYWNALLADGGVESQCGWLKDKFGLSWQIVPKALGRLMGDPDRAKSSRVMQAMLKMKKLDVAELERAYAG